MAGSFKWQESSAQTIGTTAATLSSGSAVLVGQLDLRAVTAGPLADNFAALFTLAAAWATVTGIAANTVVAELYLVPSIDGGTTFPDVDTTAGASTIAYPHLAGSFVAAKTPGTGTTMNFATAPVDLFPALYNVYILNRSGQTLNSSAVLKVQGTVAQYT
jgi:hypothetical protein